VRAVGGPAGFTHVLVDVFGIFTDDDLSDYRFLAG
jgi:hypothetical protein